MTPPLLLLNVDDHEPGRYARSRLLTQAGYEVREAGTGEDALVLVATLRPALVLLDVNLPGIDGLEVCRRIKATAETAHTPVLQISASAVTPPQRVDGLDNGADSYLVEPVDSGVLLATVRALLRMRRAEDDLQQSNRALVEANKALARANAALRCSNEDLQRFSYLASHDLQEPLRTVSSFAKLLEQRYRGRLDKDADEFLEYIRGGTERMSELIQGLLSYAQVGQEGEALDQVVDAENALSWALSNLTQAVAEAGAAVTYDPLPVLLGNSVQVAQLLQNLIGNALKYRRPDQPVRIHVSAQRQAGGLWQLAVADNGIGIAPAHHERIFTPFERLHGREVAGTGIGLATCARIVERHGGRIWVESPGVGHGATFLFTLPAAEAVAGAV